MKNATDNLKEGNEVFITYYPPGKRNIKHGTFLPGTIISIDQQTTRKMYRVRHKAKWGGMTSGWYTIDELGVE